MARNNPMAWRKKCSTTNGTSNHSTRRGTGLPFGNKKKYSSTKGHANELTSTNHAGTRRATNIGFDNAYSEINTIKNALYHANQFHRARYTIKPATTTDNKTIALPKKICSIAYCARLKPRLSASLCANSLLINAWSPT